MILPERIGHVVIKVRNLERSKQFFTEVLGLKLMMELPKLKIAFFASNGRDHHEIACAEVGSDADRQHGKQIGLQHIAFRLRDEEHLRAAYKDLKEKNVPIAFTVDHGIIKSVYFLDPDGLMFEVYCDNPPEYIARLKANNYVGMDKLDFAMEERGLADAMSGLME
jgi:catechol 2,3-dioxygenase